MKQSWQDFFASKLQEKLDRNIYKTEITFDRTKFPIIKDIKTGKELISFSCNDYLGLSINMEVKDEVARTALNIGVGASGSKFISGACNLLKIVENKTAKLKNTYDCVMYSSGYLANIGVFSALLNKGDAVFADRDIHASMIDGILLSGAKLFRYKHLDHEHLQSLIEKNAKNFDKICVASETVFSMSGDADNVNKLKLIAKSNNAILITDDAHGFGVLPNQDENIDKNNDVIEVKIGTYSKAVGAVGGYACGSFEICEFLRNYSKSQIYNTSLPPCNLAGIAKSLEIISNTPSLQAKLIDNMNFFCKELNIPIVSAAIITLPFKDVTSCKLASQKLYDAGFFVKAVFPPTSNLPILRFTISSLHAKGHIKAVCDILKHMV